MAKFIVIPSGSGGYGFDLEQVLHFKIGVGSSFDFELAWHEPIERRPMKLTLYFKNATQLVMDDIDKRFIDDRFLPAIMELETTVVDNLGLMPEVENFSNIGVYFVQGEISKRIKIGHSQDVESRLKSLQGSERLRLLCVVPDATTEMEIELHEKFAHLRVIGEWFEGSQELVDYINTLKSE